jgi:hypothetical protein
MPLNPPVEESSLTKPAAKCKCSFQKFAIRVEAYARYSPIYHLLCESISKNLRLLHLHALETWLKHTKSVNAGSTAGTFLLSANPNFACGNLQLNHEDI